MSTATTDKPGTTELVRLSPIVLLAVAMPWILEYGIVAGVSQMFPGYESLVTGRLADAFLYPVVTGTAVLGGLYWLLDPPARRAIFRFRRPSTRELLVIIGAVPVVFLLQGFIQFLGIAMFDLSRGSMPGEGFGLRWIITFVITAVVFAPLIEEILFRGLLLGYLTERGVSNTVAGGVVVVAFGAIHFYGGPIQMAATAVLGAVAVILRLRYESLVAPILLHSLFNMLNGGLILLMMSS
jgi:membrane protease YdiL (CAAX protease family)